MKFIDDEDIKHLTNTPEDIIQLFELLCGEEIKEEELEREKELLTKIWATKSGLAYEQINELLLLLNQDRISRPFSDFFFKPKKGKINFRQLHEGVKKFRGYALLTYGNFRFAFKTLSKKNSLPDLLETLKPYSDTKNKVMKSSYHPRSGKALDITPIPKEKTWLLGYLTSTAIEKDSKLAEGLDDKKRKKDLLGKAQEYQKYFRVAERNAEIYMTWDYMDVYVATSMRERWEFESCYDFVQKIFRHNALASLNLRYFDPTQCVTKSRVDKGLLESLMLKRANCTIYLAQEAETLGKDSELAATLAQGKPVIVYVPKENANDYYKKTKGYPLEFFRKRLLQLDAEGFFLEHGIQQDLRKLLGHKDVENILIKVFKLLDDYASACKYNLFESKEQLKIRASNRKIIDRMKRLLAFAESKSFERKAISLREKHPLAIQVNLSSGVANGVLVVRSVADCAELLSRLLLNSLEFKIEHNKEEGVAMLVEEISRCPYRVVTDNIKLTNSFWNFYLT